MRAQNEYKGLRIVFVGVHIRRTDFQKHLKERVGGGVATIKYFEKAMKWYVEKYSDSNVVFVIATDTYKWARVKFKGHNNLVFASMAHRYRFGQLPVHKTIFPSELIFSPDVDNAVFDMVLMSRCHHSILR